MGKAPLELLVDGLGAPTGIVVAPDGSVLFTDAKEGSLVERAPGGTLSLLENRLRRPRGLARAHDGTLFLLARGLRDAPHHLQPKGLLLERGVDGGLTVLVSGLREPQHLTLDPHSGELLLSTKRGLRPHSAAEQGDEADEDEDDEGAEQEHSSAFSGTVFRVSPAGQILRSHPGFRHPSGLAALAEGAVLVAAEAFRSAGPTLPGSLFRIDPDGQVSVLLSERFRRPQGLVQDVLAEFYLAVSKDRSRPQDGALLLKIAPDGTLTRFAQGFERPWGLALDNEGNLLVTDPRAGRIYRFLAPDAPDIDSLPVATNESHVAVSGTTEAEARITIRGGVETVTTLADRDGRFSLDVPLQAERSSTLEVYATGVRGDGLTGAAAVATILQDSTPPTVEFVKPAPGSRLSGEVRVEIAADDSLSGIETVTFLVDEAPQGGRAEPPFTFLLDTARFAPGPHTLTALALDKAGNDAAARIDVEFASAVRITSVNPNIGTAGTPVEIFGDGFSIVASENQIAFNGVPGPTLTASPTHLTTQVPAGASSGPITVTTPRGSAVSPEPFRVPALAIFPTGATVAVGKSRQFTATVSETADQRVIWRVEGVEGGNATVGTITAQGLYTAPAEVPSPATVRVQANSVAFPMLFAEAGVTVVPPTAFVIAAPSDILLVRPGTGDPGGLALNVTVASPPLIAVTRPGTGDPGGLPSNVTVAAPPFVSAVRPGTGDPGGLRANVTVAAPPFVSVTRPGTGDPGGLAPNVTVAQPSSVSVVRPGTGDPGGARPNVTVAQPHDIRVRRE